MVFTTVIASALPFFGAFVGLVGKSYLSKVYRHAHACESQETVYPLSESALPFTAEQKPCTWCDSILTAIEKINTSSVSQH